MSWVVIGWAGDVHEGYATHIYNPETGVTLKWDGDSLTWVEMKYKKVQL